MTALPLKHAPMLLLLLLPFCAFSQSTQKLIDSGNYVFKAQTALPLGGRVHNLTTDYSLKVTKSKVISDLPYYGVAYVAPVDPTQGALEFTTTSFDNTTKPGKKGSWIITIKPKDYTEVQQMILNITSAGYASLQVISTNRQAITFNGIIVAPK